MFQNTSTKQNEYDVHKKFEHSDNFLMFLLHNITSVTPPLLFLCVCTKPRKYAVMYLSVQGIDFASLYDIDI